MSSPTASNYVLGQSVHEYERLMLQAQILRPYTEKFFRAPGLRLLTCSGMGDVALLSADIVGPGGEPMLWATPRPGYGNSSEPFTLVALAV